MIILIDKYETSGRAAWLNFMNCYYFYRVYRSLLYLLITGLIWAKELIKIVFSELLNWETVVNFFLRIMCFPVAPPLDVLGARTLLVGN